MPAPAFDFVARPCAPALFCACLLAATFPRCRMVFGFTPSTDNAMPPDFQLPGQQHFFPAAAGNVYRAVGIVFQFVAVTEVVLRRCDSRMRCLFRGSRAQLDIHHGRRRDERMPRPRPRAQPRSRTSPHASIFARVYRMVFGQPRQDDLTCFLPQSRPERTDLHDRVDKGSSPRRGRSS